MKFNKCEKGQIPDKVSNGKSCSVFMTLSLGLCRGGQQRVLHHKLPSSSSDSSGSGFYLNFKKKEGLHQTGTSITVLRVGKQPTCTGDRLPDVRQRAQVGLLGLVAMSPEQRVHDLVLQLGLQLPDLDLVVSDQL